MRNTFLTVILAVLLGSSVHGQVGVELGFDQAHTSNLLKNAGEAEAWYTTPRAALRFYPVPTMEVTITGEYTLYYGLDDAFTDLEDLSNFRGGLAVSFIPRQSDDGVSVFMEGNIDFQGYQDVFEEYNNNDASFRVTAGLTPSDNLRLRTGGSIQQTAYTNSDDIDRSEYDLFAGYNWTLPGRNVFDAELGMSLTSSTFMTGSFTHRVTGDTLSNPGAIQASFVIPTDPGDSEALTMLYLSQRYSRPLGTRTGVSATATWRAMPSSSDNIVQGISSDVVSPWSSVWEGYSLSASVKTFVIPRVVMTFGAGYWHKEYLPSWEVRAEQRGSVLVDFWTFVERVDDQRRTYVSVERPCPVGGCTLRVNASVDYTSNSSNHPLYGYEDVTVTVGASLSL